MTENALPSRDAGGGNAPAADRIVLDTNVWLDWLVFEDPGVRAIVDEVLAGRLRVLRCATIRDELADVLARDAIARHVQRTRARRGLPPLAIDVGAAIATFDSFTTGCEPPPSCGLLCSDPDDQPFLDLAVAGRTRWLVTKDRALLKLASAARQAHAVEVIAPRQWHPAAAPHARLL